MIKIRAVFIGLTLLVLVVALVEREAFAQQREVVIVNSASFTSPVAADSIASAFGSDFSSETVFADSLPLPTILGGVRIDIEGRLAQLFFVSPGQINFLIPADLRSGLHKVIVSNRAGDAYFGNLAVIDSAPAVFTLQRNGGGRAEMYSIPAGNIIYLVFFGTGFRRAGPAQCVLRLPAGSFPAVYAGPAPGFVGLDQINVAVPAWAVAPDVGAYFQVGGRWSNAFTLKP